jgi:hypothetical protein
MTRPLASSAKSLIVVTSTGGVLRSVHRHRNGTQQASDLLVADYGRAFTSWADAFHPPTPGTRGISRSKGSRRGGCLTIVSHDADILVSACDVICLVRGYIAYRQCPPSSRDVAAFVPVPSRHAREKHASGRPILIGRLLFGVLVFAPFTISFSNHKRRHKVTRQDDPSEIA